MADAVFGTGEVIVTFDPSPKVSDVVVEPSPFVVELEDAPLKAWSKGSVLLELLPSLPSAAV